MANITGTPLAGIAFDEALFDFLKQPGVEGYVNFIYLDSKGIPTIGVGYALVIKNNKNEWTQGSWKKDFSAAGINLTSQQLDDLSKN